MRQPNGQRDERGKHGMPEGFWRLMVIAVLVGNLGMFLLFRLGAPDWLAVPAPILAVGIAGVIVEYRRRHARKTGTD